MGAKPTKRGRRSAAATERALQAQASAPGRPTTFTPAIGAKICQKIQALAVSLTVAAESEGVPGSTASDWQRRGQQGDSVFADFANSVMKARAQAVCLLMARTLSGKSGASQATWVLERRYHQEYGRRERLEVLAEDHMPKVVEAVKRLEQIRNDLLGNQDFEASLNAELVHLHEKQQRQARGDNWDP